MFNRNPDTPVIAVLELVDKLYNKL